jgi:putative tryptophan/tyrosine transport system substrate-binding protein
MNLSSLLLGIAFALDAASGAPLPETPPDRSVVVVTSGASESSRNVVAGFRRVLEQRGVRVGTEVSLAAGTTLAALHAGTVDLFFAVGTAAVQAVRRDFPQAVVVTTMVLDPSEAAGARGTGVGLEFPVETQLQWLRRLLPPETRRIGVVYSAGANDRMIARSRDAARVHGLDLVSRSVVAPSEIPEALAALTNSADVLWGISDDMVMTAETARSILLFSMRNRLPLVGLSSAWVKAGALVALDRDYDDIGAQCAEQAWRLLNGEPAAVVRPEAPRRVIYAVNQRTADLMKIRLSAETLRNATEVVR